MERHQSSRSVLCTFRSSAIANVIGVNVGANIRDCSCQPTCQCGLSTISYGWIWELSCACLRAGTLIDRLAREHPSETCRSQLSTTRQIREYQCLRWVSHRISFATSCRTPQCEKGASVWVYANKLQALFICNTRLTVLSQRAMFSLCV